MSNNEPPTPTKHCPDCNKDYPKNAGYFYKGGSGRKSFLRRCKPCHNIKTMAYASKRRSCKPRPSGFEKLPPEVKHQILEDLKHNKTKAEITREHGINYRLFMRWQAKGQIAEYERIEKLKSLRGNNDKFNNPHIMV